MVETLKALFRSCALFGLGLAACSHLKPTPRPTETPSLEDLVLESDWIGQAYIYPSKVPPGSGTLRIPSDFSTIKNFLHLDTVEVPWPFSSPRGGNGADGDSGNYFLLLRKGKDGKFLRPVNGRTAFRTHEWGDGKVSHTYVPYRFGEGFPAVDSARSAMTRFGSDSGIEGFRFAKYITEAIVYRILADNDSDRFYYLYENRIFQSNNSDIMLHYLAATSKLDMIGDFVRRGNYIDHSNDALYTPLWVCMANLNIPCMDTVMNHGANLNLIAPDEEMRYRMTPLHAAINLGRPDIARWLRMNGAGLYFRDQDGNLPLHNSACGDSVMLQVLAYANDSLSARNGEGLTALDMAKSCGNAKNASLLAEAMQRKPSGLSRASSAGYAASADAPHYYKSLFGQPRQVRIRLAGEAMHKLVRLRCGFQGLDFAMTPAAADSLCDLLVEDGARATLGPALAGTLGETFTPEEADSILVRYTQMAHGDSYPIWISQKLLAGMQSMFEMRKEYQEAILKGMIDVMAGPDAERRED